ncbi:MAG: DUF2075 domain-containing protein [Calditrichaeota bacterium]|nr:MAG: DUF2075 domain-containing protein [Calditrichota bacterium]
MYLDFYGLREKPFTLSPNPKFLYESASHQEAMSQFIYSLSEKAGFIVITGEVGTGKTTLINKFIDNIPQNCEIASINHKIFSTKGLVQNIFTQFGIEYSRETTSELLIKLHIFLQKQHKEGKQSVLILDEAQSLSRNLLEDIRILSNIEAVNEKYLNIFMLGQPELQSKLNQYDLRQLKDRITQEYNLKPLNIEETTAYLNHRLHIAGYNNTGTSLFSENAIEEIYDETKGIPRKINIIAEKSLLMGYVTNTRSIDSGIVLRVKSEDVFDEMEEAVTPNQEKVQAAHQPSIEVEDPVIITKRRPVRPLENLTVPGESFFPQNHNQVPEEKVKNRDLHSLLKRILSRLEDMDHKKESFDDPEHTKEMTMRRFAPRQIFFGIILIFIIVFFSQMLTTFVLNLTQ